MVSDNSNFETLVGSYDNFLQIWKEQTEDDIHRDKRGYKHDHLHLKIERTSDNDTTLKLTLYKGRNNQEYIGEVTLNSEDVGKTKDHVLYIQEDGSIQLKNGLGLTNNPDGSPYLLKRCRYFSGFIEYPHPDDPDDVYRMGNLEIHDQGGMVQLDYEGIDYTIELTQLIFAHKIKLIKIAIYDLPISQVDINSKAISYAWSSPESKRLGINLRKIISGWTFIEEGFLSSNNLDLTD